MNAKLIIAAVGTFIAGACAGISGTYIYMKRAYCERKIDEGIQEYIKSQYDPKTGSTGATEASEADDEEENDPARPNFHETTVPKYQTPVKDRVAYNEFYDKKSPQDILAEREHPLDSDEDDKDNDILEGMSEEERENYLDGLDKSAEHAAYTAGKIGANEFIDELDWDKNDDFDGIALFYWLGDDILTDEVEDPILDPLKDSLMDIFTDEVMAKANRDPENFKLFVRNHEFMKDYMIIFVNRAFWGEH